MSLKYDRNMKQIVKGFCSNLRFLRWYISKLKQTRFNKKKVGHVKIKIYAKNIESNQPNDDTKKCLMKKSNLYFISSNVYFTI